MALLEDLRGIILTTDECQAEKRLRWREDEKGKKDRRGEKKEAWMN